MWLMFVELRRLTEYQKESGFLSSFCSSYALMAYVTGITGIFVVLVCQGCNQRGIVKDPSVVCEWLRHTRRPATKTSLK